MRPRALGLALAALLAGASATGEERPLALVATTTIRDSGLLDHLLPQFEAESGVTVRAVSVGTGQALALGRRGDADVLWVHDREAEEAFVAEGFAAERRPVMWNEFVLVGPADDPAAVRASESPSAALARIAAARAPFVSRGDESGTHRAELRLWGAAGLDPKRDSGTWYRETGSGMGATLVTADQLGAYTLTDRATWLALRPRVSLRLLRETGVRNEYAVLVVSAERHPHVQNARAERFAAWLGSAAGRAAIESFRIQGEAAFRPAP